MGEQNHATTMKKLQLRMLNSVCKENIDSPGSIRIMLLSKRIKSRTNISPSGPFTIGSKASLVDMLTHQSRHSRIAFLPRKCPEILLFVLI